MLFRSLVQLLAVLGPGVGVAAADEHDPGHVPAQQQRDVVGLGMLLIMGPTALFSTIYELQCTISVNFYLYLQYFQQKNFNFSKISGFQALLHLCFKFYYIFIYVLPSSLFVTSVSSTSTSAAMSLLKF